MSRLEDAGVHLGRIGLGTVSLGGYFGPVAESAADDLLHACERWGIGWIDTAPRYGNGLAEERIGAALAGRSGARPALCTKVGYVLTGDAPVPDFSADGVRRSLEGSLERLGTDQVDIVLVHDPDQHMASLEHSAFPALEALRDEGLCRAIGVGTTDERVALRAVERLDLDMVLLAGRMTLLDRRAERDFLPAAAERGVDVVLAAVFGSGLLANPRRAGVMLDHRPADAEAIERALGLETIAIRHGVSLRAVAAVFAARHADGIVVGAGSAEHLEEVVRDLATAIPEELWHEVDRVARL